MAENSNALDIETVIKKQLQISSPNAIISYHFIWAWVSIKIGRHPQRPVYPFGWRPPYQNYTPKSLDACCIHLYLLYVWVHPGWKCMGLSRWSSVACASYSSSVSKTTRKRHDGWLVYGDAWPPKQFGQKNRSEIAGIHLSPNDIMRFNKPMICPLLLLSLGQRRGSQSHHLKSSEQPGVIGAARRVALGRSPSVQSNRTRNGGSILHHMTGRYLQT